jgi:GNAT superfamily N-acetyltransferase
MSVDLFYESCAGTSSATRLPGIATLLLLASPMAIYLSRCGIIRAMSTKYGRTRVSSKALIRRLDASDVPAVLTLLHEIPSLYPNGAEWLPARLDCALRGDARCSLASLGNDIVGVTIESPKAHNRVKLSTIFVAPPARRKGIGSTLLASCISRWVRNGIQSAHVTVAAARSATLDPILRANGFRFETLKRNLYGAGRDELIYAWAAQRSATAKPWTLPREQSTKPGEIQRVYPVKKLEAKAPQVFST